MRRRVLPLRHFATTINYNSTSGNLFQYSTVRMSDPSHRIISHMNKDHHLAIVDYVVVYGNEKLDRLDTDSVRITDVTVDDLVLEYKYTSGKANSLRLGWNKVDEDENLKVKTMLDIKAKLIAMAKYAASKQGFSHKQVTQVLPPTTIGPISCYVFAALALATYYKKDFLRSAFKHVMSLNPPILDSFLTFFEEKGFKALVAMYAIHILEVVFIGLPETRKYRMPLGTKLGWLGIIFFEGLFHKKRLNTLTK